MRIGLWKDSGASFVVTVSRRIVHIYLDPGKKSFDFRLHDGPASAGALASDAGHMHGSPQLPGFFGQLAQASVHRSIAYRRGMVSGTDIMLGNHIAYPDLGVK